MKSRHDYIHTKHVCTKDDPWTRSKTFYGFHPDAVEVERTEEIVTYDCPHCGRRFRECLGDVPFDLN